MRLEDLLSAIDREAYDLEALHAEFLSATGSEDVAAFAAWLKDQGILAEDALARLAAEGAPKGEVDTFARQKEGEDSGKADEPAKAAEEAKAADEAEAAPSQPPAAPSPDPEASRSTGARATTGSRPVTRDRSVSGAARRTGERRTGRTGAEGGRSTGGRRRQLTRRRTGEDVPGAEVTRALVARGHEFVGKLGEGAMGEVLSARDLALHRVVAYKQMSDSVVDQPALGGKFWTEAQITAQLEHPNIVPIYRLEATRDGRLAYTMKRIEGRTIEELITETRELYKARKPIDEDHSLNTRLEHFLKVCDAIAFAHSRGVVHRDLKPENIMVGPYNEVYVMDWGISRLMPPEIETPGGRITIEGDQADEGDLIIGTPQYMSPEQASGLNDQLTGSSDQYALGLILFELISLKPAVTGKTPIKIAMRQQDAEKDPLVHVAREAIPPELVGIVHKATRKDIAHRYPHVEALADDIRRFLRGEAVTAVRDTTRQRIGRWISRHREATLLGILVFFMLSATTVIGGQVYYQFEREAAQLREERLSALLTQVGTQGAVINSHFVRYEGLLGIVAASAVEMLTRGDPRPERIFMSSDFDDPDRAPADLQLAPRYGIPISLEAPVGFAAQNTNARETSLALRRLLPLQRYQRRVMLRSHTERAASAPPALARRLIAETGVPLAWVHVGLENGAYLKYPGHGGIRDTFDPRTRPWYRLAQGERGPRWGAPETDNLGLVLPLAVALHDEEDALLGVAAVELTFDYIINELLEMPDMPPGTEAFLLNQEGRRMVSLADRDRAVGDGATRTRALRTPVFLPQVPEVGEFINAHRSGYIETVVEGEPKLIVLNRLHSLGWYYVVMGDRDTLLRQ